MHRTAGRPRTSRGAGRRVARRLRILTTPNMKPIVRYCVATLMLMLPSVLSWAGKFEVDLNGFRLQQLASILEPTLGRPIKTLEEGNMTTDVYAIDQDAYMVFGRDKRHPNNISLIQLTGSTKNALPFKGLLLGDPKSKIIEALGQPDRVVQIQSPDVTRFSYERENYSIEVDDRDRLYSIQIFTTAALMTETDGSDSEWARFKAALRAKDIAALLEMMRPDVEIYRGGRTLSVTTPFDSFRKNPDSQFVSALIGPSESVLRQINDTEPVQELRLAEKVGVGMVYKFPNGKILREIVFFPFNGKYRVYEIAFR